MFYVNITSNRKIKMLSILPLNAFTNYKSSLKTEGYKSIPSSQLRVDTFERVSDIDISFKGKGHLIKISPSILAADYANLASEIRKIEQAGADWVHIDVMDGHFVPSITIGAPVVKAIKKITHLPLDVHLMISNPEKHVEEFAKSGANIITFHYEAAKDQAINVVRKIKAAGAKAGIAIKPSTKAEEIYDLLPYLDQVLVMTVEPGAGGQGFMSETLPKIRAIRKKAGKNLIIQVDGGINKETGALCRDAGANSLVAGTYIYGSKDIPQAIDSLRG